MYFAFLTFKKHLLTINELDLIFGCIIYFFFFPGFQLFFVQFDDDLRWKENAVVLRNGAGLFSKSYQGPLSSNQS